MNILFFVIIMNMAFGAYHKEIDSAFWKEGVGAFSYQGEDKKKKMIILLPNPKAKNKYEVRQLYLNRSATDWNEPGPVKAWDENLEFPTLKGSIKTKHWHGYIIKGEMK